MGHYRWCGLTAAAFNSRKFSLYPVEVGSIWESMLHVGSILLWNWTHYDHLLSRNIIAYVFWFSSMLACLWIKNAGFWRLRTHDDQPLSIKLVVLVWSSIKLVVRCEVELWVCLWLKNTSFKGIPTHGQPALSKKFIASVICTGRTKRSVFV